MLANHLSVNATITTLVCATVCVRIALCDVIIVLSQFTALTSERLVFLTTIDKVYDDKNGGNQFCGVFFSQYWILRKFEKDRECYMNPLFSSIQPIEFERSSSGEKAANRILINLFYILCERELIFF